MANALLDFRVNWDGAYRVTYEFRTDMVVSRSGREQRRSLRATARKQIEYGLTLSRTELHRFHQMMVANHDRTIDLVEMTRFVVCSAGMAVSSNAITAVSIPPWLVAGATVALVYLERMELRVVQSISGMTVVFTTSTIDHEWPAGTKIAARLVGSLANDIRAPRPTNETASVDIAFDVDPASEIVVSSGAAAASLDGREIFLIKPNWGSDVSLDYSHVTERVDYGFGRIAKFVPSLFETTMFEASYVARNAADADAIRMFFERMGGQRGEFYMPTWQNDLDMRLTAVAGTVGLRIKGQETYDVFKTDTVYRALAVFLRDGSRVFKRISSMSTVSDGSGSDTVIQVATVWSASIAPEDVLMICWMPVWRLASDKLILEWVTDTVAQTKLTMKSLENLAVE